MCHDFTKEWRFRDLDRMTVNGIGCKLHTDTMEAPLHRTVDVRILPDIHWAFPTSEYNLNLNL
jgi:hypothetical protein